MAKSFQRTWGIIFKGMVPVAVAAIALCAVSAAQAAPILPTVTSANLRLQLEADMGVTQTGSGVSLWADQSGNGFNAEQTVDNKRPTLVANASANGLYSALRFDGVKDATGDGLINTTAGVQAPAAGGITFFIVYNKDGGSGERAPFWVGTSGSLGALRSAYMLPDEQGGNLRLEGWARYLQAPSAVSDNVSRLQTFTVADTRNQASIYDRVLGDAASTLLVSGTPTGGALNNTSLGFQVGGQSNSGVNPNTYYFKGDISAILVYTGELSDADRIAVDNYLYEKYFAAVPEPSSFVLLGASAFGLLGLRRRRA